jgi:hypothetical protein
LVGYPGTAAAAPGAVALEVAVIEVDVALHGQAAPVLGRLVVLEDRAPQVQAPTCEVHAAAVSGPVVPETQDVGAGPEIVRRAAPRVSIGTARTTRRGIVGVLVSRDPDRAAEIDPPAVGSRDVVLEEETSPAHRQAPRARVVVGEGAAVLARLVSAKRDLAEEDVAPEAVLIGGPLRPIVGAVAQRSTVPLGATVLDGHVGELDVLGRPAADSDARGVKHRHAAQRVVVAGG